ncbi:hypothetical protein [Acidovorax sp. A1169]|uniref:hypothetical protein n=1 Tax=Acidovorax sp. A1169 TaxID=3059524 RepID=UPI002737E400|nr:hypothetical protein [Acidovorax sp. A1169]MDP4076214.1 hypothetical protein [Acidovorax sp. A1169]
MQPGTQEAEFLRDIAKHQINVIRDDGLYRHIRFSRPNSMCMHFDLITWPGYLCYCGDMGTYVFTRLADMFEFFRTDRRDDDKLRINLSYWSEKLLAVDGSRRSGSAMEFSYDRFERVVKEQLVEWWRDHCTDAAQRRELREQVEEALLGTGYFSERPETTGDAIRMANDFEAEVAGKKFQFQDFWDHSLEGYTHRFTWCCYALAWGIQQYDLAKEPVAA